MTEKSKPKELALYTATLVSSQRITPESSRDDVKHLTFRTTDLSFSCSTGQSIRVMAPGEHGNRFHPRLYSIAGPEKKNPDNTEFALCVRRHMYVDDFNGQEYKGVASNYLCDLKPGDSIQFAGPFGLAFPLPEKKTADIIMVGMGTGIAPFRALVRYIYENLGGWEGDIRLFYGAKTGLEMLYMNNENSDLAHYYDEATFKAFRAVSPKPHFDAPIELDKALQHNATEVWTMLKKPDTHLMISGPTAMLSLVEKTLSGIAGSEDAWKQQKNDLVRSGRWSQVLY